MGPMNGKMYLVIIDAHSKWIEAFVTTSFTSTTVIEILQHVFAQFGIPGLYPDFTLGGFFLGRDGPPRGVWVHAPPTLKIF